MLAVVLIVLQIWISLYLNTNLREKWFFLAVCNVIALSNEEVHYQIRQWPYLHFTILLGSSGRPSEKVTAKCAAKNGLYRL